MYVFRREPYDTPKNANVACHIILLETRELLENAKPGQQDSPGRFACDNIICGPGPTLS